MTTKTATKTATKTTTRSKRFAVSGTKATQAVASVALDAETAVHGYVRTEGYARSAALLDEDRQYQAFERQLQTRFNEVIKSVSTPGSTGNAGKAPLFTTDAGNLFTAFLAALPAERRQHYNCDACRRFVDRFGGLVAIDAEANRIPLLWDIEATPPFFKDSVRSVLKCLARSKVDGVFLSSERLWGIPQNRSVTKAPGIFSHMHVVPPAYFAFAPSLKTADQVAAEKREDYGMLCRGLAEYKLETVRQAHTLLASGNLYRSEHCIGIAKWLLDLYVAREDSKGVRAELTWRAVATAPAGFCHVKTTMISTLLDDIEAGLPFDEIKRNFDRKMNPLAYQRAQAAPTEGNIKAAEAIISKLQAAGSLERRFARFEDVKEHALWMPREVKVKAPSKGGVFDHLKPKEVQARPEIEQPPVLMTWMKFVTDVLPTAETIEYFVHGQYDNYGALVTAANMDAPPILQWDSESKRNPVSWYVYGGNTMLGRSGSNPATWNLKPASWTNVTAIVPQPNMWCSQADGESGNAAFAQHGRAMFFLLEGARDVNHQAGGGYFVELLKNEYREAKRTLEAYMLRAPIAGRDEATACGFKLQKMEAGVLWENVVVRVRSNGTTLRYKLDRWD